MQLFPYQVEGVGWLANQRRALLADEMGLGKSAQAVRACDETFSERVLVICPAIARPNWEREFAKFSFNPRRFAVCETTTSDPGAESAIISYDLAVRFTKEKRWRGRYDALIIDESHYIKNESADRTEFILGREGVIRITDRTYMLSGTPMPSNPSELWPMLFTFGRTKLRYQEFCRHFCKFVPGYKQHLRITGTKPEHVAELRELLRPIMLQRKLVDVGIQLPDLLLGDLVVEAAPIKLDHERLQKILEQEEWLRKWFNGRDEFDPQQMHLLEALANSVSTLRYYNGLQKVKPVAELVSEELRSGAYPKILLFCVHQQVAKQLAEELIGYHPLVITGETSPPARQAHIDAFQRVGRHQVMICNIRAAGTAITLTAAAEILFVESEWSPGDNRQALKRVHRIGQLKKVRARFVGIANSIDEKVQRVNRRKAEDIDSVFG